jgi:hypothetical protein
MDRRRDREPPVSRRSKIKLVPSKRDAHGNSFAAAARCGCGDDAQLPEEYVEVAGMFGMESQLMQQTLTRTKCGRHGARIEIYHVPRI